MNIFKSIVKGKLSDFKSERRRMFWFLSILGYVLTPVVIIFIPLPGYLLYLNPILSWPNSVGWIGLFTISFLSLLVFYLLITPKNLAWIRYIYQGHIPWWDYIGQQFQISIIYLCNVCNCSNNEN